MDKTWLIEMTDKKGDYKKLGEFTGTTAGMEKIKDVFGYFQNSEAGYDVSMRYTKLKKEKRV